MVTPKSIFIFRALVLVFVVMFSGQLKAQCNPPEQLPTAICDDAPLTCLNDACYTTLNIPMVCCNNFCGNSTIINNPQYFEFIAIATDVQINIHVDNCTSGSGLQSAIVTSCAWQPCPGGVVPCPDILACNAGTGPGGTMMLFATGLVIGQSYWLLIDGSSGSTCQYTINFIAGVFEPQIDEDLTFITAMPTVVCQGYDDFYLEAGPNITNAHGYYWIFEWTTDTLTSTLPEITFDIPDNAPTGIWEICAQAFSGCDVSDTPICLEIEIVEQPDIIKPAITRCPEEFPFSWHNVNISGPGTYTSSFDSPEGCPYDSIWTVDLFPMVPEGEYEVLFCMNSNLDPYEYEGNFYFDAGDYPLDYPNMGLNGCDSTAVLKLTLAGINGFIDLTCENGEFAMTPILSDLIPFNAVIDWEWYKNGVLVYDNIPYYVLDGGCYELFATVHTPLGTCTFLLEQLCFNAAEYQPVAPNLGFSSTTICAQAGVFFTVIEDPFGEDLEYFWSGPFGVNVFQDGSNVVEMDFSASLGGTVCVYAGGECGLGPSTCFDVGIIPAPVASFSYALDVCADSTTIVTFTGSASPTAEVIWDFDNPSTISGTGTGPFTLSWSVPGNKLISLTVIEPGCDTVYSSGIILVSNFQAPVVNCSSTISSVDFDWNDVVGANCYLVSINGAPAVPTCNSNFQVSPLNPGDTVQMVLTVISAGPCDDIVVTAECIAQDCPPPVVVLSGQDSACLNNPAIIDLDAVVNGNPGLGTWDGPGITDAVLGLFDPKIATSGQHQLTFTTIAGGCPFVTPYLITVFDSITADFTIDPTICISDNAILNYTGNASPSPGATYSYNFGAANVVSGTGEGPYQLDWNSPGMMTVRLQISENGCMSDIISHNTNVVATLNPPVINCAPNTSGVLFTWTVDNAASGHIVNTLSGQTGAQVGNSLDFGGLNPGDIVEIEIITQSAGPCPDRRDTLSCVARACPMPVIAITPVIDICLYPGTAPVDLDVTVTGGMGVGDWSGPGVTDMVNGTFDPVLAGAGSHQIVYHYVDDGCDFNESITINVYDPPGAFISNTEFIITCASPSLFLDGSASSGGPLTYLWSTSGTGAIVSGGNTAIAEVGAAGVYKLRVTNAISGCADSISVTVTQDANIPTSDAGPDKTITCDSTQFVLGGNSTTGPDIIYTWTTMIGNIVGPANGKQINANKDGQYNLVVRDTVTGCQATDIVMVGIDTAIANIMLTAGDTIDCNTTTSTAQSMISGPIANYTFNWTTIDGTIEGVDTNPQVDMSQGGTYTLTIKNKINGCVNSADVFVPESDEIIDAVDVSLMNIVCHGQNNGALVINSVDGGIPPYTYQWSVSPLGGTMLSSLAPGNYSLTVSDQNGCSIVQMFTLTQPDLVTLDLGPNMTVAGGDSVELKITTNLTNPAIGNIDWGGYDGLFCPGCPVFQFIASSSATISAMISDTAGCTASDSMRLTVIVPRIIYVPTVFSPNGDNINDYFTISGRSNLVNIGYLRIYDRWGNQVFEKTNLIPGNEQEGWDGRFRGELMQPGVYVYVAQLDYEDRSEVIKGDITILK